MKDAGKQSDYFAPYSPYRESDDLKLSNGILNDATDHMCIHVLYCSSCNKKQVATIYEALF